MSDKDKAIKCYTGLPVPMSVAIFGLVWLIRKVVDFDVTLVYSFLVPVVGYLHISKIKIKKITSIWFYAGVSIIAIIAIILGLFVL